MIKKIKSILTAFFMRFFDENDTIIRVKIWLFISSFLAIVLHLILS